MEYIWETIGEKTEKYFYKQAEEFGPYNEIVRMAVKESENEVCEVEYNSLYRYDSIFSDMLTVGDSEGEWKEYFFDACTHLLLQVEGLEGLDRKELRIRQLMYKVENGLCFKAVGKQYKKLSREKKYQIASYYILQEQVGESIQLFAQAVTVILENAVVYKCTFSPRELLVYLGEDISEEKELLWQVLKFCFLPISYEVRLFETAHFAVMDEEQTMYYERLEIF